VLTASDKAKLDALPEAPGAQSGAKPTKYVADDATLQRASTRAELEETKRAVQRLQEELARKQDADDGADQEAFISVGGGSAQVQASAAAKAAHQHGSSEAQGASVQQLQQQLAELRSEVARHEDQLQEVRVHVGLQLSLPDALGKIREFLGVTQADARGPNDVLRKAKEFDIVFDEAANLRDKVQQVCAQLSIETGWEAQAAAPEPEYDDAQREELTLGGGGDGAQDDDIC
jgi:DNA repair exonuclease SbcCD ATPase subunit